MFRPPITILLVSLLLTGASAPAALAAPADRTRTEYLAQQLRENPVFLSDHIPRAFPPGAYTRIKQATGRTGVPTYLMAVPIIDGGPTGEDLIAVVHDRLGADGLYVLLGSGGSNLTAQAYGIDLPVDAAETAVLYELPYDAGPVLLLERFVEVVTLPPAKATARAEKVREKSRSGWEPEPITPDDESSPVDRENRLFLTGSLLSGIPVFGLSMLGYVHRRRKKRRSAADRSRPPRRTGMRKRRRNGKGKS